ncbi:MAG: hypothetical protein F4X57_14575 [Chloroflexi bacterium]|nr:hypothetical protein [Chloroflexota bacterium]
MQPNFADKTIWTGDNLDILRGMNSESVDLIYLDPPFNSNRNYSAPVGAANMAARRHTKCRRSPWARGWAMKTSMRLSRLRRRRRALRSEERRISRIDSPTQV